ncbi:PREDICTED: uncharacterized protein LOC105569261 isoform X2 [Vollenhovia emeryi]|uniref:uncharacterized protein LOC105569261 isoform X2 n=1 Tax=Vollenhovia emeryi TaxID=411798 RepID=UPI0005F45407|nr:PREDICTED: uncharacterized protein LOC105569261 isoform X2 [Vollenhovia emeryi]
MYRELFLALTISLASVVLADVLVQPGYQHGYQYSSTPHYVQYQPSIPQYQFPAEQYRRAQIPNHEWTQYLSRGQTYHPYDSYQDNARTHMIVHNRRERSRRSVPTSDEPNKLEIVTSSESSKPDIVAHDNDVAAKSTLTDAKPPTAIDSLLPEHETTDTNDKHVENRQINYDHVTEPRLFGLYPENMHSEYSENIHSEYPENMHSEYPENIHSSYRESYLQSDKPYKNFMQKMLSQLNPHLNTQLPTPDSLNDRVLFVTLPSSDPVNNEPYEIMPASDDTRDNSKYRSAERDSWPDFRHYLAHNTRGVWPEYHTEYRPDHHEPQYFNHENMRAVHQEFDNKPMQRSADKGDIVNTDEPKYDVRPVALFFPSSLPKKQKIYHCAETPTLALTGQPPITFVENEYRNNDESSRTSEIVSAPYSDTMDRSFSNYDPNKNLYNKDFHINFDKMKFNADHSIHQQPMKIPDYVFYTNATAPRHPKLLLPQVFLDSYPPEEKIIYATPPYYKYHDDTQPSDKSPYNMFSSPVYY